MNITDIPATERYGRDVREGHWADATHHWCPSEGKWVARGVWRCVNEHCGKFWSRVIDPGAGHRMLGLDEEIKDGDQHFGVSGDWAKSIGGIGNSVGHEVSDCSVVFAFRRKVEQPAPAITWPTPIATADRLPTKEDANVDGYVLVWTKNRPFWLGAHYTLVNDCTHWMPQPPAPAPRKSEAELAWEEYRASKESNGASLHKCFLAAFAKAKGADAK